MSKKWHWLGISLDGYLILQWNPNLTEQRVKDPHLQKKPTGSLLQKYLKKTKPKQTQ